MEFHLCIWWSPTLLHHILPIQVAITPQYTAVEIFVIWTAHEEDGIEKCQTILCNSKHTNFAMYVVKPS